MSMALWDKKKQLQTVMARRRDGKGEVIAAVAPVKPEIVKDDEGHIDHLHVAAQDMLSAIHEKSAEALMRAIVNFIDMYEAQPHEEALEE
jgi:predicted Abi (CAAX) family protease